MVSNSLGPFLTLASAARAAASGAGIGETDPTAGTATAPSGTVSSDSRPTGALCSGPDDFQRSYLGVCTADAFSEATGRPQQCWLWGMHNILYKAYTLMLFGSTAPARPPVSYGGSCLMGSCLGLGLMDMSILQTDSPRCSLTSCTAVLVQGQATQSLAPKMLPRLMSRQRLQQKQPQRCEVVPRLCGALSSCFWQSCSALR